MPITDAAAMPTSGSTFPYWVPMILFGILTFAESNLEPEYFPIAYVIKAIVVTGALYAFREPFREVKFNSRVIAPSILVGLAVFVAWVLIHENVTYPQFGGRSNFDPTPLEGTPVWSVFLAVRLYGLILMVPVMEELFWRSFLLRYLTHPDFRQLPMGTFSALALAFMVAGAALTHPEWLVAIIASLAYAFWLRSTRSLFGVIVAHAATNAALGGYVLITGKWQYW